TPVPQLRRTQPAPGTAAVAKTAPRCGPVSWKNQPAVNQAIDRGVAYLQKALPGTVAEAALSKRLGAVPLAGVTLLSCGVPPSNPAVADAVTRVRDGLPTLTATYELACCVWLLDKLGEARRPRDREALHTAALRLIACQGHAGGWKYHCPLLDAA